MSGPIAPERLTALLGRWANGPGPLYRLLARRLRALIEEGALAPETVLPAERRLAAHLSVGRGTVVAAYDQMREEEYLVRRQGSGTRVAPRSLPVAHPVEHAPNAPQFLGMFEPPSPGTLVLTCAAPNSPPPELLAAYASAVERLAAVADDIGYHPAGHPELRAAVAERYTRRGLRTDPDQVLVTSGAQQAIELVVRGYVVAGDAVLAENPTYPGALALFGAAAAAVRTLPVDGEGLNIGALLGDMARLRPALTYLIPSFHNPTGTLVPPLHRRRIAEAASEHGLLVIDDETLAELGFHGDPPPPLAAFPGGEHIVTIGSLSKLAWGGMRVGWVRAERAVIARLSRLKALGDLGNDITSQLAGARLLVDPDSLVRRRRSELSHRHGHLTAELARALPGWEWVPAQGGQTLWVRLPSGDAASFAQRALRHGVALLPGDALAPGGASHWMRIPFLADEETLSTAVQRIKAAWDSYAGTAPARASALGAMVV